jgi:hypothetical protein
MLTSLFTKKTNIKNKKTNPKPNKNPSTTEAKNPNKS